MRPFQSAVLAAFVCLLSATSAIAGINSITPSPLPLGSVEAFITIHATPDVLGDVNTIETLLIAIDGPAGPFLMEPNSAYSDEREQAVIQFWVPWQVAVTPGQYSLAVSVKHFDAQPVTFTSQGFTVEVEPEVFGAPLLVLPEAVVAEATSVRGAIVDFDVYALSQSGGQTVPVTCSARSGDQFPLGFSTVQCSASDANGTSQGEFYVFVQDTERPTMTLPDDIVTANPVVTYVVTATDSVDGPLPVLCHPASGSTFPVGTTEVFCAAEDSQLNPAFGTFKVTVVDGSPVLTVPSDITAEATGASGAVVSYVATATNGGSVVCSPASGSTFALGTTTVSCTATNAAGSDTKSFKVNVVDTTAPVLTLPANITTEALGPAGAVVTYNASATDTVDGSVSVACTPASGATFALGTTDVSCSATDAHNNKATGSFDVKVVDTTPPQILQAGISPELIWPPDHKMIVATVSVVAYDAADTTPVVKIISVTSNQPVNGTGDGDMAPDWNITGPLTVELRAERAGNVDRVYKVTFEVTDDSGNASLRTLEVRVAQMSRRRAAW